MNRGEKIAKARREMNLTQDQLAEMLEVTRQTISKWESNLAYPESVKLGKLAEVLNVTCDYLLRENQTTSPSPSVEVTMSNSGNYTLDWSKLYPILNEYQDTVDCPHYYEKIYGMVKEIMVQYKYSSEDTFLILKDLLYQVYLQMEKKVQ
ncbi:helix-turn-helix domain-containing protein [Priestia endophytica]|jgi:transcriptional regulator with XRE-family HTH domain|uniref:Transcriptional regulator, contains XRE-family HTH domain n=1 Tax=Priestia endophytica DSM 13796 TaxID=1121089 RepID=A0A1I6C8K9_9BACI|nr:helix-turn-helix transcriptional regulator [Priestia endophytica]KYG29062.1 DNA-binding protein [Priestia endophytica]MBG9810160.1 DNA-binding protein [Priestia endophytica]MBG9811199.1 DNA-binding protein [Priestia endophytica]MBG9813281.1 DNA-binding protein [Priestia endophytica]MBG9813287.1 DNA-binding protein [Priestia endophytica]